MPGAQRATIASEVHDQLNRWIVEAKSYMDQETLQFKSFMRSVDKLSLADPYEASLQRALLFHFTGDMDSALHWIRNAKRWPGEQNSQRIEGLVCSNLGYFARSVELLVGLGWTEHVNVPNMLFLGAAFDELIAMRVAKPDVERPEFHSVVDQAVRCAMTLESLNISQAHLRKVLDLAGEVLRAHRLFFAGDKPTVLALDDCFLYQLQVDVDPSAAALMTREVIVKIVENDLDLPGLSFAFLGTRH